MVLEVELVCSELTRDQRAVIVLVAVFWRLDWLMILAVQIAAGQLSEASRNQSQNERSPEVRVR